MNTSDNNSKLKVELGLLIKIVVAVMLGVIIGYILSHKLPVVTLSDGDQVDIGLIIANTIMIFKSIFGNFLGFIIPLLIIGLVAPGIGNLRNGAGTLLVITVIIAYTFTIFAGFFTYVITSIVYPFMLEGANFVQGTGDVQKGLTPYFTIPMPPLTTVTTGLILAFVLGFGLAVTKTPNLMKIMEDFREIVNKIINAIIIPLLPYYIFTIFLEITVVGEIGKVLAVFLKIIAFIFLLTILLLLVFFGIAGVIAKRNPFKLLVAMAPAYVTALGTSSSAATIPITYQSVRKIGVKEEIADFVVPLCATINLSGSMLKIVACSFAIILTTDMDVTFSQYVAFIFTLAVAMVAAPGVPGGAIMTAIAPLASILGFSDSTNGLMIALYIVMDSFGTAANVTSDGAIATILDKIYRETEDDSSEEAEVEA